MNKNTQQAILDVLQGIPRSITQVSGVKVSYKVVPDDYSCTLMEKLGGEEWQKSETSLDELSKLVWDNFNTLSRETPRYTLDSTWISLTNKKVLGVFQTEEFKDKSSSGVLITFAGGDKGIYFEGTFPNLTDEDCFDILTAEEIRTLLDIDRECRRKKAFFGGVRSNQSKLKELIGV